MIAVRRVDELGRYSEALTRLANTALEHSLHVELLSKRANVVSLTFKLKDGCARDYTDLPDLAQSMNDFFRQAIAEVFVLALRAQVDERKDGDGFGVLLRLRQFPCVARSGWNFE